MIDTAKHLSNEQLLAALKRSLSRSRAALAELLVHLGEVDARKLYRNAARSSMFEYCVRDLNLSEGATFKRIAAARAAREFPVILEAVADGKLHLTAVYLLAPHLTEKNHREVLARASRRSKRQVEMLVAELRPQPDVAASVRRLPRPTAVDPAPRVARQQPEDPASRPAANVEPLAPSRYKVTFTADETLREKLRRAQDLLGHSVEPGDVGAVIDRALSLLVDDLEKKKNGRTPRPRSQRKAVDEPSRYVPAAARRKVCVRDGDRCTFVNDQGTRCESTFALEYHHDVPHGMRGLPTAENIRLMCKPHNQLLAERDFGSAKMQRMRAGRQPCTAPGGTG